MAVSTISIILITLLLAVTAIAMGVFRSKNHMPVDGKTIIITGASEGMGLSAARQLSAKGANIVIISRSVPRLEAAVKEIKAAAKNPATQRFHFISADVSQPDYAGSVIKEAIDWNNGQAPDIVWCIAGKANPDFWISAPLSTTRNNMDVNFWGNAEMAHAILRQWLAPDAPVVAEPKHFIFTTSVVAFLTVTGYGPYAPSKWAIRGLADTLVQEVGMYPQNVKIHVVYPGTILSPGYDRENQTKPEITHILEKDDPKQTPDATAAAAIRGLERGEYSVTVSWLGFLLRCSGLGGAPRNYWVLDTILSWIMTVVWMFVFPDLNGKVRKYASKHGHPATYTKDKSDE